MTYPQDALLQNKVHDHWNSRENTDLKEELGIESRLQGSILQNVVGSF